MHATATITHEYYILLENVTVHKLSRCYSVANNVIISHISTILNGHACTDIYVECIYVHVFVYLYVLFHLGQLSHFSSCFGASVINLNEPPSSFCPLSITSF